MARSPGKTQPSETEPGVAPCTMAGATALGPEPAKAAPPAGGRSRQRNKGLPAQQSSPLRVPLEPVLDLKAAAPLRDLLVTRRGSDIELDCSEVQRLGGLCLQVLLATRKTWRADGLRLSFSQPSEAFSDALRLFGAADLVGL